MRRWRGILIHHSAGSDTDAKETEQYRRQHLAKGWLDIGYHFVVERVAGDYVAVPGRSLDMIGSHCPGKNASHLGVCFAGNFETSEVHELQLSVGAHLVAKLCLQFAIPLEAIEPHRKYRATLCPGSRFPMAELVDLVAMVLGETTPPVVS